MTTWEILHLIARVLLSAMFIRSGVRHLTNSKPLAEYAKTVGHIPAPEAAVIVSGLMLLLGGLSILLGVHPRIGAALVFVFLVIAAFTMHAYWKIADPMQRAGQDAQFWKNLTMAGAALWIVANTGWPWPWTLG